MRQFCAMTTGTELAAMAGIVESNPGGKPFITQLLAAGGELQGYYRLGARLVLAAAMCSTRRVS